MNSSYTLLDVVQVVFRHKGKFLFVAGLTMLLAVIAIRVWPRSYASEAKLLVKLGRESVTLDPTANTGKLVSNVDASRESEVNTAIEVLGSRTLIEQVVHKIGAQRLVNDGSTDSNSKSNLLDLKATAKSVMKLILGADREVPVVEDTVTKLHKKISCETTAQQSNVITATALAKTPEMAHEILQALIDCFLDEHIRIHRVEGSMEFFARKTADLEADLNVARSKLRDAKNLGGLVSVTEQQRALEMQIAELQRAAYMIEAEAKSSAVRATDMQQLVAAMPERLQTESATGFDNLAADSMKTELFKLQMKKLDLMSKYTEDHPMIQAIREQADQATKIVGQQSGTRSRATMRLNPARATASIALTTEIANSGGLHAQAIALNEQICAANEELLHLNASEVDVNDLEIRVKLLEDSYTRYYENLEQAKINDALEREKISNISVVQPPTFLVKPRYPNKSMSLVLGMLASLFLGFMTTLVAEQLRQPAEPAAIRSGDAMPVLVAVSKTRVANGRSTEGLAEPKQVAGDPASTQA